MSKEKKRERNGEKRGIRCREIAEYAGKNLVMCAACVISIDGITHRTEARLYGYVIARVEGIVLRSIVEINTL